MGEAHLQPLVASDATNDEDLLAPAVRHRSLRRLDEHREQRLLQREAEVGRGVLPGLEQRRRLLLDVGQNAAERHVHSLFLEDMLIKIVSLSEIVIVLFQMTILQIRRSTSLDVP